MFEVVFFDETSGCSSVKKGMEFCFNTFEKDLLTKGIKASKSSNQHLPGIDL